MQIISVNVGQPREVNWKGRRISTGIFKQPVAARVMQHEETLVIVRALDEEGATKYDFYLSNAPRNTPAKEFAPIEDALARLEEYQASKSVDKWGDADETFHRELMRLSGNARLYGFGCQLRDFAKRAHLVALRMQTDAYRARSTKNHGALLAALRGPYPDEAVAQHQAQRRRGEEALVGVVEKFHLTSL